MLSNLKNWVFPDKKKTKNSEEVIIPVFHSKNRTLDAQKVPGTTANGSTRKYITYEKALKNLKESSERHLNDGYFMDKSDLEAKNFIDLVQKEVSQYVVGNSIKDLNLRGRKSKAFTAWVLLQDNVEFRVNESFLGGGKYGNPEVTAVTLLIPGEEKRGLRISIDEDKARLYEIVNGSYDITFNWKVDDKNCSITMNVSINGTVACTKASEGLIWEDLDKNKDAKIRIGGTKNRKMTLTELVSLGKQQHKSHEVVKFVANDPEVKSALKELGSELQKGNSTEKSAQTEDSKAADTSKQLSKSLKEDVKAEQSSPSQASAIDFCRIS